MEDAGRLVGGGAIHNVNRLRERLGKSEFQREWRNGTNAWYRY